MSLTLDSLRTLGLTMTLAVLVGACTASGPSQSASLKRDATPVAVQASPTPAAEVELATDAMLVVGQRGVPGLQVIVAGTREQIDKFPDGAPGERWAHLFATSQMSSSTVLRDVTIGSERPAWPSQSIDGAWRLPTIGADPLPGGLSSDESTVVLVEAEAPAGRATSRFAVLTRDEPPRNIELPEAPPDDASPPGGAACNPRASTVYILILALFAASVATRNWERFSSPVCEMPPV